MNKLQTTAFLILFSAGLTNGITTFERLKNNPEREDLRELYDEAAYKMENTKEHRDFLAARKHLNNVRDLHAVLPNLTLKERIFGPRTYMEFYDLCETHGKGSPTCYRLKEIEKALRESTRQAEDNYKEKKKLSDNAKETRRFLDVCHKINEELGK